MHRPRGYRAAPRLGAASPASPEQVSPSAARSRPTRQAPPTVIQPGLARRNPARPAWAAGQALVTPERTVPGVDAPRPPRPGGGAAQGRPWLREAGVRARCPLGLRTSRHRRNPPSRRPGPVLCITSQMPRHPTGWGRPSGKNRLTGPRHPTRWGRLSGRNCLSGRGHLTGARRANPGRPVPICRSAGLTTTFPRRSRLLSPAGKSQAGCRCPLPHQRKTMISGTGSAKNWKPAEDPTPQPRPGWPPPVPAP